MNLKQLSAFREVMLTGTVSEAARNLYRTQPAISALIAGLEDDIGDVSAMTARVPPGPNRRARVFEKCPRRPKRSGMGADRGVTARVYTPMK